MGEAKRRKALGLGSRKVNDIVCRLSNNVFQRHEMTNFIEMLRQSGKDKSTLAYFSPLAFYRSSKPKDYYPAIACFDLCDGTVFIAVLTRGQNLPSPAVLTAVSEATEDPTLIQRLHDFFSEFRAKAN